MTAKRKIVNFLVNNGPSRLVEIAILINLTEEETRVEIEDLINKKYVLKETYFDFDIYGVNQDLILDALESQEF